MTDFLTESVINFRFLILSLSKIKNSVLSFCLLCVFSACLLSLCFCLPFVLSVFLCPVSVLALLPTFLFSRVNMADKYMGSRKNARQRRVEKRLGKKTRPLGGLVKITLGCPWCLVSLHHAMAPPMVSLLWIASTLQKMDIENAPYLNAFF